MTAMRYEEMEAAQKKAVNKQCRKCKYSWCVGGKVAEPICVYFLETDKRRNCSTENCEKFERKTKKRTHIGKDYLW